jgi:hypothetical protein
MDARELTTLRDFARAHHVHYEVEPEEVTGGARRELVGVRLRLLATHERSALGVPGCPACVELLGELRSFADRIVAEAGVADRAETIPAPRKLYQSAAERSSDEVALTIRVRCHAPEHRQPGAGGERCIASVRERLADLGVGQA